MEINITQFVNKAAPMDYSASVAEIGANAGADTWRAACDDSTEYNMLNTDEKRDAFRDFVRQSGGWNDAEITRWSDKELNALFIQWVSGDMRECGITAGMSATEWETVSAGQSEGITPSNIFRADDGEIYFYAGS